MWSDFEGEWIESTYLLEGLLGQGSFGGVFRAKHTIAGRVLRNVAVKLVEVDPDQTDLQLNEVLHATTLRHPHLLACYHAGRIRLNDRDLLYMVLELAGGTLERAGQHRCFEPNELLALARDISSALLYLHNRKIVHRDVKPANILWVNGEWKLSDLGTLRPLGDASTIVTGTLFGSLLYMPPEALHGTVAPSWDMWSLGIALLITATRQKPYKASTETALCYEISKQGPQIPAGLPRHIDGILRGCLTADRTQRWTARDLLDSLDGKNQEHIQVVMAPPSTSHLGRVHVLHNEALQANRDGRLTEALALINETIRLDPNQPTLRLCRANIHFNRGDHQNAALDYCACLEDVAWDESSVTNALDCAILLEQPSWAFLLIEQYLKKRGTQSVPLLLRRGRLHMISGDPNFAGKCYAQAQWLDLDNEEPAIRMEEICGDGRRICADERRFAIHITSDRIGISYWDSGYPEVLEIEHKSWVRAAVGISREGNWVVGHEAEALYLSDPERVAIDFIPALGHDSDVTDGSSKAKTLRLRRGPNGAARLDLGAGLPPEAALAMLLRLAAAAVAKRWRAEVLRCVIAVPTAFGSRREETALRDAVDIAGLWLSATVHETVASFAWLTNSMRDRGEVAFVDFQGSTQAVLIAKVSEGAVELKSCEMESQVGLSKNATGVAATFARLLAKVQLSSGQLNPQRVFVRTQDDEFLNLVKDVFRRDPQRVTECELATKGVALLAGASGNRSSIDRLYQGFFRPGYGAVPQDPVTVSPLQQSSSHPTIGCVKDSRWKERARKALIFLPINGGSP